MLDPQSGLDPATRELAETRLFAERALFIARRMPDLLRFSMPRAGEHPGISSIAFRVESVWIPAFAGMT